MLEWAQEPLATAEIALIMQTDAASVRSELARIAHCLPAGADAYWSLQPSRSHGPGAPMDALVGAVHATRTI